MKKTLSITVYNESGVLTRISTVFSSRGFNIDSIAVGPTENNGISKIIIVLPGDNQTIEQITKQLNKLIQVIEVKDITNRPCVERELMLLKVKASPSTRSQILEIVQIFRSKVVDLSDSSITVEVTGDPGKILTIIQLLTPYKIIEIVRSGKISIERGKASVTSSIAANTESKSISGTGYGVGMRHMLDKSKFVQVEFMKVGYKSVRFPGETTDIKFSTTLGTIGMGMKF
jgi:acetolactate synthase-1/3 small subunit